MARSPAAETRSHIDAHVGKQLASARMKMGLNQSEVARMLGLTFQQIQKYEKGTNRMSASVLWTLSEAMDLPIAYFFDGLNDNEKSAEHAFASLGRNGVQMADVYSGLSQKQRTMLLELAREISGKKVD